jgi:hydrogenase nickel incorporation protein HypA/HybF
MGCPNVRWRLVHETGMCEAIVDATLRRAAGRSVAGVRVRIGGHAVDRDVVTQGIQLAAAGTVADGLDVDLVLEPMSVHCGGCGRTAAVTDHLDMVACPACGGVDVELNGTDAAMLESITLATAGPSVQAAEAAETSPPVPTREGSHS